jgi:HK97 family phage major capsid protein
MADTAQQIKELGEEIGRKWDAFKAANDDVINQKVKKGVTDALAEAKLANISADFDASQKKFKELEDQLVQEKTHTAELERKVNLMTVQPGDKANDKEVVQLKAFNRNILARAQEKGETRPTEVSLDEMRLYMKGHEKILRGQSRLLTDEERKTMQVGVDAEGGYLVPPDLTGNIVTALFDLSPIRQYANVQTIGSDRLDGPVDTDEVSAGWVAETDPRTSTNTPKVGKWEIVAQEIYAFPFTTQRVLDDAAIDVEAWLAGKVADKFARVEGTAFVAGTGVGQPRGFTTYVSAATADNSRLWGTPEHVATGTSGGFAADPAGGDVLFDLEAAFRPGYLNGAAFCTRRSVIAKVRKMKATTGNYLFQPGLTAGQPNVLIGYPIIMAEDMPAMAANSLSLALANFKTAYQIVDRLGLRTIRDPLTNKPYVGFYTTKRTGGDIVNFQAIKFLKFI